MSDNPNQDVVDALFDSAIAKAATWQTPGADPQPCRVIAHRRGFLSRGAQPVTFHGSSMTLAVNDIDILVRASEVAAPAEGDTFTLTETGLVFPVGEAPMFDDTDGLVWRCNSVQGDAAE